MDFVNLFQKLYIVDLFKKLNRKANITLIIYLVLNYLFISAIVWLIFGFGTMPFWKALIMGFVLYALSLLIALSPIGEWILRLQTGCKKMKRTEDHDFFQPLFEEVYEKAKKKDSSIPKDVRLYINSAKEPNAFALGRKTICVTEGMRKESKEHIKATLGHEFGHLAHKDTDLLLLTVVGNLFVTIFITVLRIILLIIDLIFTPFMNEKDNSIALAGAIGSFFSFVLLGVLHIIETIWAMIGLVLLRKASRENEYEADEFSYHLGYGYDFCDFLDNLGDAPTTGFFASLASTHPPTDERIARLQNLGVEYTRK